MSFKSQIPNNKYQIAVGAVVLAMIAAIYLLTFQTDICSNPSEYVIDSGEYQIALALWGTVHHTGAPAYSLVGAAFVSLLRLVSVAPAAGAALFSVACSLVALGFVYALGAHLTGNPWAAGAAVLALALGRSFWINNVIAEQRSFGLALAAASLWLAVRFDETRSSRTLYALAFVWGQAVVHHRLAVLMVPALIVMVAPGLLSQRQHLARWLAGSVGMGALAFAFYLYMPLRAHMGAWTYGDPGAWQGFWYIFWAREVPFLMNPPSTLAGLLDNMRDTFAQLIPEWTAPGLVAAGLGLIVAVLGRPQVEAGRLSENSCTLRVGPCSQGAFGSARRPRGAKLPLRQAARAHRFGWALMAWVAAFMVYLFIWHEAVSPEKVLLWVSMGLALALATLIARLWRVRWWAGAVCAAALVALASMSVVTHRGEVLALTRDPRGRQVIALLKAEMPTGRGGIEPTFMALWGGDYFAAAYGNRVTGELKGMRVVDHRADFRQIVDSGSRLVTLPSTFYELNKSWWRERIGGAYLSSVGLGLVEIGASPPLTSSDVPPGQRPVEIGDGISLLAQQIRPTDSVLHVTLYWQAAQTPSQNYSVFVHLSDRDQISGPGDIIAQADSQSPVYGWYPTTRWSAGEIVREDYGLMAPSGKTARLLAVGLYTRDAAGAFHNLGVVNLPLK